MNWNPLTWFKAKAEAKVFVSVDPNHPHVGLSVFTEAKAPGACFCVEGISLGAAKLDLCGKVLDWDKMPAKYIAAMKTGATVTLPLDRLKSLFR
jgi:hypothetical protein